VPQSTQQTAAYDGHFDGIIGESNENGCHGYESKRDPNGTLIARWSMDVYSYKKMVMSCHRFWPIPIWNSLKFYILVEFNISRIHEVNLTWTQQLGSSKISSPWWKFQVEFDRFKKMVAGWTMMNPIGPWEKYGKNGWLLCW
jgi:hypothetical protein